MFAAVILIGIAQRIQIPYPIVLVLGGAVIGFIPELHAISFNPNLILIVVLPPILYYGAFGISFRMFKHNLGDIFSLALVLVFVTTFIIGVIFKWLFPQFPWALAFAFGAIVSPPDAIAATTILKRFGIGLPVLTVLEGESLINDASALVLYKLSVTALLSGMFSFQDASIEFIKVVSGGVLIGFVLGFLMQHFSKRYLDPVTGVVFSFVIPYITYISADSLGVSGVLAVVVNGLMGSQILPTHHSPLRRILGYAAWDIFIILMNCFVFILIGLQLRTLTRIMTTKQIVLYAGYALLITVAMIAIRMIWVYSKSGISYLKARAQKRTSTFCTEILREGAILGWSGMRGIVSLVAALALPFTLPNGMPLEGRSEVIFITFLVILYTLVLPGLTLPLLIRRLNIPAYSEHYDAHKIRKHLAKIAEDEIKRLYSLQMIAEEEYDFLKAYFHLQRRVLEISSSPRRKWKNLELIRLKVIKEQRKQLLKIWEQHNIDDKLLSHLEHELDLEETSIARAEL